jgi:cell division cycle 20-like protein 1 (cofactor of APC complex)
MGLPPPLSWARTQSTDFRPLLGTHPTSGSFIPTRDGTDLHAAYTLLGAGDGEKSGAVGPKGRKRGASVELDGQRGACRSSFLWYSSEPSPLTSLGTPHLADEANKTFSHLLKSELFSATSSVPSRPHSVPPPLPSSSLSYQSHADAFPSPRSRSTTAGPSIGGTPTASFPPASPNRAARSPFPTPTTPSRKRLLTYSSPGTAHTLPYGHSRAHSPIKGSPRGLPVDLDDPTHPAYSLSPITSVSQNILLSPRKPARYISKGPFKVLDAPELADDYYLNLVDWSATNVLGVGLGGCVYMWSANTSRVTMLCDLSRNSSPLEGAVSGVEGGGLGLGDRVTSISWTGRVSQTACPRFSPLSACS